ncbi:MAG: hypothetical protein P9M11_08735 [Candidatus Tenebribacter burtonii]|nr:hypothetical protein [Candidatus Tenebribacter burtonii]
MSIQMLLVLVALVLFSTLMLNTYNILLDQSASIYDNMYYLQGQKIADKYFQKIEADLLGNPPAFYFSQIKAYYSNITETETVNNLIYNINLNSTYCDSLGNTSGAGVDTLYQKMDIRINCLSTSSDTLYIGTKNYPFSKIFINRGF